MKVTKEICDAIDNAFEPLSREMSLRRLILDGVRVDRRTHHKRAEQPPEPGFRDRTADLGLELANSKACWVDVDNDGWTDLCSGGIVWRNNSGKGFTKLAAGVSDVVAADFDNDGFADLFSWSPVRAYRNQGGHGFEPMEIPELPKCVSSGACWADFNGDGFVDVYVGGYEDWDAGITYPDLLLMNEKGKSFQLAWSEVRFRARGVTSCDFDQDGDVDVYVSNYRLQPNVLWLNDGAGQFADVTAARNALGTSPGFDGGHSIGSAWGDFDNDGKFDLFVGNFAHVDDRGDQPKSRFLRNLGAENGYTFNDRGPCGVFYQESYASPSAGDFDNDGDLDLFFTTVYETASFGRKNNPVLFRNDGDFVFADATSTATLTALPTTYQAAWSDFDHDGDLDLVSAGKLFENVAAKGGGWRCDLRVTAMLSIARPLVRKSASSPRRKPSRDKSKRGPEKQIKTTSFCILDSAISNSQSHLRSSGQMGRPRRSRTLRSIARWRSASHPNRKTQI